MATPPRGLDHLVLPVRDLDAAAGAYERLGFTLTPRAEHPWGTANRLAQFGGSFLEILAVDRPGLIGAPPAGRIAFGAFNRDFLTGREGPSMLVLESTDSDADLADFAAAGFVIQPRFDFERTALGPDGAPRKVAFSLAFACPGPETSAAPSEAGFFTCRQIHPENFWKPDYQKHPNGALDIAAVTLVARDPADHHEFLAGFVGTRDLHMTSLGLEIATPRGRIEVLTPAGYRFRYGVEFDRAAEALTIAAARIAVADPDRTADKLTADGVVFFRHHDLIVVDEAVHGLRLAFERAD